MCLPALAVCQLFRTHLNSTHLIFHVTMDTEAAGLKIVAAGAVHASHADGSGEGALAPAVGRCGRRRYVTRWFRLGGK